MIDINEKLLEAYDRTGNHSGVSGERLALRLSLLSEIGRTTEGGSCRIGYSHEERAAKDLVRGWMVEAGLAVREDEAGNIIARLPGAHHHLPAILSGSHVDTVPNGGHFDGALGVLVALEVVEAWKDTNFKPKHPFEVIIFSDEEGARFNTGLTGSKAMTGELDMEQQRQAKDVHGVSFEKVISNYGLCAKSFSNAKRDFKDSKAFVEVHIEQGKRLENANLPVGVVSGIAGLGLLKITFTGTAGHAGNTPMNDRFDPLTAAGHFIYELKSLPEKVSSTAVATVGKLQVFPNGINVIAKEVELYVDIRDIYEETLQQLIDLVIAKASESAKTQAVEIQIEKKRLGNAVLTNQGLQDILLKSVEKNGSAPMVLPSGAGHDAMILSHHLPMAMLFVRSQEGISHNPREWSSLNDCVHAVHILKDFIEALQEE
ncbi:Zn-dependent hydrolase [Brevibacillus centrosporus]|uniref:Zn-dependent hydrolase n=1 Tax=Brevibacillus centrosporus TaxID=54910 RepID=UPI002E1F42C9